MIRSLTTTRLWRQQLSASMRKLSSSPVKLTAADPQDLYAYDNLAGAYEALNRFDEAKAVAEEAIARKLQVIAAYFVLTDLAYMRGDAAAHQHQLEAVKGTSAEQFMLFFNAAWQGAMGKVRVSRDFWQRARETPPTRERVSLPPVFSRWKPMTTL